MVAKAEKKNNSNGKCTLKIPQLTPVTRNYTKDWIEDITEQKKSSHTRNLLVSLVSSTI